MARRSARRQAPDSGVAAQRHRRPCTRRRGAGLPAFALLRSRRSLACAPRVDGDRGARPRISGADADRRASAPRARGSARPATRARRWSTRSTAITTRGVRLRHDSCRARSAVWGSSCLTGVLSGAGRATTSSGLLLRRRPARRDAVLVDRSCAAAPRRKARRRGPYGGDARLPSATRAPGPWNAYTDVPAGAEDRDETRRLERRSRAFGRWADVDLGIADLVDDLRGWTASSGTPSDSTGWRSRASDRRRCRPRARTRRTTRTTRGRGTSWRPSGAAAEGLAGRARARPGRVHEAGGAAPYELRGRQSRTSS